MREVLSVMPEVKAHQPVLHLRDRSMPGWRSYPLATTRGQGLLTTTFAHRRCKQSGWSRTIMNPG